MKFINFGFFKRIYLFWNTARYLKLKQIIYRLYYWARNDIRKLIKFSYPLSLTCKSNLLHFDDSIPVQRILENNTFTFLNRSKGFLKGINWNFSEYGKLWAYNLNYFDYLNQPNISKEDGLLLVDEFISSLQNNFIGLEPYPLSVRCINWIKFIIKHGLKNQSMDSALYSQYHILLNNIEYHILGNHILENGFSLLFGAYYFNNEKYYKKAKGILQHELNEQINDDGAHFELSPMYHKIILVRLLDCINLVKNNDLFENKLLFLLKEKAKKMLIYLSSITFKNGNIPLFNDSANGIAPSTIEIYEYAKKINVLDRYLSIKNIENTNNYRKFIKKRYEMIVDVGDIGAYYIPGHAHSDTFSFELYVDGKPFIVDTGTSTYENNTRRSWERSTKAHNTVQIEDFEQSEVWSSFRVARRARVIGLNDSTNKIIATHNGYKHIGASHKRAIEFDEKIITITDWINGKKAFTCYSYLHFYPGFEPIIDGNSIIIRNIKIIVFGCNGITIENYKYAPEFNKLIEAKMAVIVFRDQINIRIIIDREDRVSLNAN